MSEHRSPSNPPETVPWSEYRIMVDQRDSFREDMVRLREQCQAALVRSAEELVEVRGALQYLQKLIAEDDLPADARSLRYAQLQEYRDALRDEGYDPGPSPVEVVE